MYTAAGNSTLSAYQVAAIRILSASIVFLPIGLAKFKKIPIEKRKYVLLSGLIGSFIPAFLFCIAETKIDSSLAGILNALTPVFTIIIGSLIFKTSIQKNKILGVCIAFAGMLILFLSNKQLNIQYFSYAGFVLIATICYGFNVNIAGRYLREVGSMNIAAIGLGALSLPSLLILFFTGFFELPLQQKDFLFSTGASVILGVLSTGVATILFYALLKKAGTLFTSMVTYGIPFVALGWGLLDGDQVNAFQIGGLAVILTGVYMTNKT